MGIRIPFTSTSGSWPRGIPWVLLVPAPAEMSDRPADGLHAEEQASGHEQNLELVTLVSYLELACDEAATAGSGGRHER